MWPEVLLFSFYSDESYHRLWWFSAPRQLGTYYYISAYIITVTRPGLLSTCALNRMLQLEHDCVRSDDWNTKQNAIIAMAQAMLEGFAVQENPTRKS